MNMKMEEQQEMRDNLEAEGKNRSRKSAKARRKTSDVGDDQQDKDANESESAVSGEETAGEDE